MDDDWIFGRANEMKDTVGIDEMFPVAITANEIACGFEERILPNPSHYAESPGRLRIVVLDRGDGTLAVKTADPNGRISYAIWDATTRRPVAAPVESLAQLRPKPRS